MVGAPITGDWQDITLRIVNNLGVLAALLMHLQN